MDKIIVNGEGITLREVNPTSDKNGKPVRTDQSHFVGDSADQKTNVEVTTWGVRTSKTAKRTTINMHTKRNVVLDEKPTVRETNVQIITTTEDTPVGAAEAIADVQSLSASCLAGNSADLVARVKYNAKGVTSVNTTQATALLALFKGA